MGNKSNHGFTSIVVSLILVLVFSLITLGFATIARREQQNALNQQLATKANYVAESGINLIVKKIKAGETAWSPDSCGNNIPLANIDASLNDGDNKVTCAIVNITPPEIRIEGTPAGESKVTFVETDTVITKIPFNWAAACASSDTDCKNKNQTFVATDNNPSAATWKSPPVIQLSITPLNSYDRNYLINNTFTAFLYPSSAGINSVNADIANNAKQYLIKCDASKTLPCSVDINVSSFSSKKFLIRYMPIYSNATTESQAYNGSTQLSIKNSQALIDITAKSQDVLKRLKVRVPISSSSMTNTSPGSETPDFALHAANVCKRMKTYGTSTKFIAPNTKNSSTEALTDTACNGSSDGPIVWN